MSTPDDSYGEVRHAQAGLRESIEQAKRLASESDALVQRCRGDNDEDADEEAA